MSETHDLVIVGGGPAGLTAAIYAANAMMKSLLIEKETTGGQMNLAALIENFPGFPEGIRGFELGQRMYQQAMKFGLNSVNTEVKSILYEDGIFKLRTSDSAFLSHTILVATGAKHQKLNVPGEEKLLGKGVSYCAVCDGGLFRNKPVAVIGGGNSAVNEALYLSHFVSQIYLIHRRDALRASALLQQRVLSNPKIKVLWNTVVEEIQGDDRLNELKLHNSKTGQTTALEVSAAFVAIGSIPNTDFLRGFITLDESGSISTNEMLETNIPGVFAAGDVRRNSPRQAIVAAGEGAYAALQADALRHRRD